MIGEIVIATIILLGAFYLFYSNVIKGSASGKCSDCSSSGEGSLKSTCCSNCSSCSSCSMNKNLSQKAKP